MADHETTPSPAEETPDLQSGVIDHSAISLASEHKEPPSLKNRLSVFLSLNPETSYSQDKDDAILKQPWGDPSLAIAVKADSSTLIDALNSIRMPPRFSAIWHRDTREMEFIYATLRPENEFRSRVFRFTYDGHELKCKFGDSSKELLEVAAAVEPIWSASSTSHRNLQSFNRHMRLTAGGASDATKLIPTSFWVGPVDWDDDVVVDIMQHLNFYMTIFDYDSPHIAIHDARATSSINSTRYPYQAFPEHVEGKKIDSHILMIWHSLLQANDPLRIFLYAYQILEYRAFYYIQEKELEVIRKVVAMPDVARRIDEGARRIYDVVAEHRMPDDQRMVCLIRECADRETIWEQISQNVACFTSETKFDGGFTLDPLLDTATKKDFDKHGWSRFPERLRQLRNALVHGREARQSNTIAPTRRNHSLIGPWLGPVRVAAQEVILKSS